LVAPHGVLHLADGARELAPVPAAAALEDAYRAASLGEAGRGDRAAKARPDDDHIILSAHGRVSWRAGSERLQVLEQLVLLLGRQVCAIEVPGVAVAAHTRVVLPAELLRLGAARDV